MQRDLSTPDIWEESLRRSRERRERAAATRGIELPARGVSLAAALVLTGAPVAVAANEVLDGGSDGGSAGGGAPPAAKVERVAKSARAQAPSVSADPSAPAASSTTGDSTSTATPDPAPAQGEPSAVVAQSEEPADEESAEEQPQAAAAATVPGATALDATAPAATAPGGIEELQRELGVTVDGDFGRGTERALKRWQREHDLEADGIAGPETRRELGLGEGPVLKREKVERTRRGGAKRGGGDERRGGGKRGGGVEALQRALGVSADGVFGPGTESALKSWQRRNGLTADGIAGPQTRRALGIGPGPVLKRRRGSGGGGGSRPGASTVLQRVIAAANAIANKPYRYGGGHGSFNDSGYDCSGSVSYALHGAGLLPTPLDSSGFMSYGAPGPGKHVTIYAHPGHVYMVVDGRRFDTSARWETGSRWTSTQRSSSGYTVRHPPGL